MAYERALRGLTLITTAVAVPLLIATTVVSLKKDYDRYWDSRHVTAFCFGYIPLAATTITSVASLIYHRKHGRMPGSRFILLDAFCFVAYLSILLPIWLIEIGRLVQPGWGLLAGYLTAPMIVNMLVHAFFVLYNLQWLWSRFVGTRVHQCPNCHNNFIVGQPEASKPSQKKEGYSLLRGEVYLEEEEEPVPYTDMRSMEVGQAAAPKEDSKGKDILSV